MTMQKNWIGKSFGCDVTFPLIVPMTRFSFYNAPGYSLWRYIMLIAAEIRWSANYPRVKLSEKMSTVVKR